MWELINLSLTSWMVIFIIILLTNIYMSIRSPWKRAPPGPPSFPVIGSLPFMGGDIREVFTRMAARYGQVFTVSIGPQRAVVLNGYDTIKQAFIKTPNVYDGRSDIYTEMTSNLGLSCNSGGETWKVQRRFLLQTLKDFGMGKRLMEDLIQDESGHLVSELQSVCGAPYNMQNMIMKAVSNVICMVVYGKRHSYDDPVLLQRLKDLFEYWDLLGPGNAAILFKFLRKVPGDPFGFHRGTMLHHQMTLRNVDEIKTRKSQPECHDLIRIFLNKHEDWSDIADSAHFEAELAHVVNDLFAAGSDTTTQTLMWAILYLIVEPDTQAKIHAEIDQVVGRERSPSMQHRQDMSYTEAFISEVQRISILLPHALPHATTADTELCGYVIPRGTMVIPDLYSVHFDPQLWPEPYKFEPNRFLDNSGKYIKREELVTFSIGKRACPGEGLAKVEVFLFLTHLLQAFTFSIPPGHSTPSTEGILGLSNHPKPYTVVLNNRL